MYDINIVANHPTIILFRRLEKFQLDLGRSVIDRQSKTINVEDKFLAFQMYEHNRMVNKMGKLGKVNFYYDNKLPNYRLEIYFDTKKHEKYLDTPNIELWLKTNLLDIEQKLTESNE